jgi:hypothetical protein
VRLFLPDGYVENREPAYFHDASEVRWQPEVYSLAGELASLRDLETIIDVGCGSAEKALGLGLRVVGIDHGPNLPRPREDATFLDHDLEGGLPRIDRRVVVRSVVVCADVIEHLIDPLPLLLDLGHVSRIAPVLISTPDRDLVRGEGDLGPPANPCHVREWDARGFAALLEDAGLKAEITHTIDNDRDRRPTTLLAVCA